MASMKSSKTRPYHLHLGEQRGHIEGLTYLSADSPQKAQCHYFGGIPYSLPPIGPYRWRKPRPLPPCYRYGTRANPGRFTGGAGVCPQPGFNKPPDEKFWDEDCLQVDVWVPTGKRPERGWPIYFYIHGGWLQIGTPNATHCAALLGETSMNCIIVCPAYRLNVFGFLACNELQEEARRNGEDVVGNYGFLDQRLALEWTYKNASYFGGNAGEITVGGYSAGAQSTFYQLAHDLYPPAFHPNRPQIIRRIMMHSNGPGPSPKPLPLLQSQATLLLTRLNIPSTLPPSDKLARLRATPATQLIAAIDDPSTFPVHEFRAVADDAFIPRDLFEEIDNGGFARRMVEAGVELLVGECEAERFMYAAWRPPLVTADTTPRQAIRLLRTRLEADYAPSVVDVLLKHYCSNDTLPAESTHYNSSRNTDASANPITNDIQTWQSAFGALYADIQVHALQRGFLRQLTRESTRGAADNAVPTTTPTATPIIHRYRISYRASCVDSVLNPAWGVTHSSDLAIWFWGCGWGGGLSGSEPFGEPSAKTPGGVSSGSEKDVVRRWMEPVWAWMRGEGFPSPKDEDKNSSGGVESSDSGGSSNGVRDIRDVRRLRADSQIDSWWDKDWERGCKVWDVVRGVQRREIEHEAGTASSKRMSAVAKL